MNFVPCTTSYFELGSFLETKAHDIIKYLKIEADNQMST